MVKAKKWILSKMFDGKPKLTDFKLDEEELSVDSLKEGEILCEALFLSVDPYMRFFATERMKTGDTMIGQQVSKVLASGHPEYEVGSIILARGGWKTHSIVTPFDDYQILRIPDIGSISPSIGLGVVGMTGMTAYFGLLDICKPQPGETVLVNAAAGAVGSIVGQIAKIKGCKVIGYAGTDDKVQWLKELGFDVAFNYKKVDIDKSLTEAAPDGIDCYFDCVGGGFSVTAMKHMKLFGRIAICGSISEYNATAELTGPLPFRLILGKQLKIEGFIVRRYLDQWPQAQAQMIQWIKEGKVKYRETIVEGFENMPTAFMGLFEGSGIGKTVVKP